MNRVLMIYSCFIGMFLASCTHSNDIQTLILQPDGKKGKDNVIVSLWLEKNKYVSQEFASCAWTAMGKSVTLRSLLEFDLSQIPKSTKIIDARLSLFSYGSMHNGNHTTSGGSNESVIQRIIQPWDEAEVHWGNQPLTTEQNQVFLLESVAPIENYLNIDVTTMIQDMINNPEEGHGFMLKLVNEVHYRRMLFASSDNYNSNLHPKLELKYVLK